MTIFETADWLIREFTFEDAGPFFLINSDEQVMRYIRPVKSKEDSDVFLSENIRQYRERPGTGRWAVAEKNSGRIIGMFSLLPMEGDAGKLHIGYAFLPDYWGKGYATVLLNAGSAYFFEHNAHDALYAITRKENVASERVLLKCGFELVDEHKEHENTWRATSARDLLSAKD
jgi:RimJ/RimL family protein N-acetyltransferase